MKSQIKSKKAHNQNLWFLMCIFSYLIGTFSYGNVSETDMSTRSNKKVGAYVSLLGEPYPTLVGVNVGYNIFDFLRASLGYGEVSVSAGDYSASLTSIGLLTKGTVPGWNFSPSLGLGYTHVSTENIETSLGENNVYTQLGFDWQTKSGFNLGAGLNISLNGAAPAAPFMNLGWFFDFI